MAWRYTVMIFIVIGFRGQIHGQLTDDRDDCPTAWVHFAQCLHQQQRLEIERTGLSEPNEKEQAGLESDVRSCFKKFDCRDPLTAEDEFRARLECFRKSQFKLRSELQDCVKKSSQHFVLPEDNFGNGDPWSIFLVSLNDAVKNHHRWCPKTTNEQSLKSCVEKALMTFVDTRSPSPGANDSSHSPQRKTRNYCDMKAQCKSNVKNADGLSDQCEAEWHRLAAPRLCNCAQDMRNSGRIRAYQADFLTCMNSRYVKVNVSSEPAFGWLENGLNAWCPQSPHQSTSDPCGSNAPTDRNRVLQQSNTRPTASTTAGLGSLFNWFRPTSPTPPPDWLVDTDVSPSSEPVSEATTSPTDGIGFGIQNTPPTEPNNGNGFGGPDSGTNGFGKGFSGLGGFGNLLGINGGGLGGGPLGGGLGGGPLGGGLGGGPLGGGLGGGQFGGGLENGGSIFEKSGGSQGSAGGLFGGLLNHLGIGNPFDGSGIFGSLASIGQLFQNLLGAFGG